jgi:PAS domain-containing protein
MQGTEDFLGQLARELAAGTLDADGFQVRANQHIANNPELVNMVWVAADQRVKWTAPFDTTDWLVGDALAGAGGLLARARELGPGGTYGEAYVNPATWRCSRCTRRCRRGASASGWWSAVYSIERMVASPGAELVRREIPPHLQRPGARRWPPTRRCASLDESFSFGVSLDPPGNGLSLQAIAYRTEGELPGASAIAVIVALSFFVLWSLWLLRMPCCSRVRVEKERDRLFNLSLDMLAVLGHDGVFRRCNPAFERVLGYTQPEVLPGQPLLDFIHAEDVADTVDDLRSLASGTPVQLREPLPLCRRRLQVAGLERQLGARGEADLRRGPRHHRAQGGRGCAAGPVGLPQGDGGVARHRPAGHRPEGQDHLRQPGLLPHDRLVARGTGRRGGRLSPTGRGTASRPCSATWR